MRHNVHGFARLRKYMVSKRSYMLMCAILLSASPAHAESEWIGQATITRIENVGSYSWITLDGMSSYADGELCMSDYGFIINNQDDGYDPMLRVLLSAYLSGKSVMVKVEPRTPSRPGDGCRVTRVRF